MADELPVCAVSELTPGTIMGAGAKMIANSALAMKPGQVEPPPNHSHVNWAWYTRKAPKTTSPPWAKLITPVAR